MQEGQGVVRPGWCECRREIASSRILRDQQIPPSELVRIMRVGEGGQKVCAQEVFRKLSSVSGLVVREHRNYVVERFIVNACRAVCEEQ